MKGIILKDLYENFRIFKNGVSYLAAVLFLFLLIEAMQTGDLFSLKYFFMRECETFSVNNVLEGLLW